MAQYKVKDPQGKEHIIDGPEGATPDQVMAQAQRMIPQQQMGGPVPLGALAKTLYDKTPMGTINNALAEDPAQVLPIAGGVIGSAAGPLGTAAGAGVGQIARRMVDLGTGRSQPGDAMNPVSEAIAPMAQTAMAGLPEVGGVKSAIQKGAQTLGRRALGFTKGMLKKHNFGVDQADDVAQTMLDKGVIRAGSGTKETLERAEDLAAVSGKRIESIGSSLTQEGKTTLDPNAVGMEISKQLTPAFSGGAYEAEKKAIGEILDTVGAHGNGPITFESAQALKQKLGELAKFNSNTDAVKANLYRRAYGIVTKALDDSIAVGTQGTGAAGQFAKNKALYGQSQRAIGALSDKQAGEAANNMISLRGAAAGGIGLATGNIQKTFEAIGAWELLRRRGEGTGAAALNFINNSAGFKTARDAAYATFIDKMTTKENSQ